MQLSKVSLQSDTNEVLYNSYTIKNALIKPSKQHIITKKYIDAADKLIQTKINLVGVNTALLPLSSILSLMYNKWVSGHCYYTERLVPSKVLRKSYSTLSYSRSLSNVNIINGCLYALVNVKS